MSRFVQAGIATLAVASLAACSNDSISPDNGMTVPAAVSLSNARAPEQVVGGEVIVKLKDMASAEAVASSHGLSAGEHGYKDAFVVMRGAAGAEHANANALKGDSRVEYAEPNYLRTADAIRPELWAFYNKGGLNMLFTSGSSKGKPLPSSYASKLDADEDNIEGYAAGGNDVVIGSIDTGVQLNHPEFTGRLIPGKDWVNNDNDPSDDEGHGTHTTGTMAGSTVGVAGVSGAGAHVRVYVQRVCGRRGCPTTAIVNAIRAAADYPNLVAMNLSLGGSSESQSEKDAISYATSKNVLVIASAGNDGTGTVSCPACDPNAISVSATNWSDGLSYYSNYGPGLDIAAPGGACYSNTTADGCIYSAYNNSGYTYMQGTSMAAPQVTGTAAIVASKLGLRGSALRSRLLSTADPIGSANQFGAGRVNSYRAVTGATLSSGL